MAPVLKVIKLKTPIDQGQGKPPITELSFRAPEAGDFWNIPLGNGRLGDILEAAGKTCGMLANEMKKLSPEDMMQVVDFFGPLIPSGPPTGGS